MSRKVWFPFLMALGLSSAFAGDITFKGAAWDSLAIPLKIVPFYLTVDRPVAAKEVSIELDLYVKGVFVKTIQTVGLSVADKKEPLKINYALNFFPSEKGKIEGTATLDWDGFVSTAHLNLDQSVLGMLESSKGRASGAIQSEITSSGRAAVFYIIMGGTNKYSSDDASEIAKRNPDSTVLIGYLKTE